MARQLRVDDGPDVFALEGAATRRPQHPHSGSSRPATAARASVAALSASRGLDGQHRRSTRAFTLRGWYAVRRVLDHRPMQCLLPHPWPWREFWPIEAPLLGVPASE